MQSFTLNWRFIVINVNVFSKEGFEVGGIMSQNTLISKVQELGGDTKLHGNTFDLVQEGAERVESTDAYGIRVVCNQPISLY